VRSSLEYVIWLGRAAPEVAAYVSPPEPSSSITTESGVAITTESGDPITPE
jgi:hypothetical protein